MKMRIKNTLWEFLEFFAILILLLIRVFVKTDNLEWINKVNYIGLFTALLALFLRLLGVFNGNKQVNFIIGSFVVILLISVFFGVMFFSGIIAFSAKTNNIILLLTLLVSLPMQLYEDFLVRILK